MSELRTGEPRLRAFIDAAAGLVGLPPFQYRGRGYTPGELLEGLILSESAGNPRARRYEPHQDRASRTDAPRDPDIADQDDGELEDDASYGLCQVMGFNARVLCGVPPGIPMRFGWLFLPQVNIATGLRILHSELTVVYALHPHESQQERLVRALARYNGGPTGDSIVNGDIRLRVYVDRVAAHAEVARADRRGGD